MWVETTDDRLVIGITLPVTVERAWAVLTTPASIARWWGNHVRFDAWEGGSLLEGWVDGDGRTVATRGRIRCCEPPCRLVMGWADDDWPGDTTVEFRLEKDGERTWLRLEQSGWEILPVHRRASLINQHAAGWRRRLGALGALLGVDGGVETGGEPDRGLDRGLGRGPGQDGHSAASPLRSSPV